MAHAHDKREWILKGRKRGGTSGSGLKQVHNDSGFKPDLRLKEYQDLLNEISDGLCVVNGSGKILYANLSLARILGFKKPSGAIGKKARDFMEPDQYTALTNQYVQTTEKKELSSNIPLKIRRSDGSVAYIEVWFGKRKGKKAPSRYYGIVRDITKWKDSEGKLQKNETLYQSIVELSPNAVILTTVDGRIASVNAKAVVLYGLQDGLEPLGLSIMDLLAPEERARGEEQLKRLVADGGFSHEEYRLQRQDGTIFWGELNAKYIPLMDSNPSVFLFLSQDITERKATEANLKNLSVTDELTGLYNRRGFTLIAEQELRHAHRSKTHVALLFFDMDEMKSINDSFGHTEGDAALQATAAIMRRTFRDSDILARWGGDEFVVLALNMPEGCIPVLVDRFHKKLEAHNQGEEAQYRVSFSVGVSNYDPETPLSLHELVMLADKDMYRKKQSKASSAPAATTQATT